jgi:DNA invertase Pin-like site-specific DNA recombinase
MALLLVWLLTALWLSLIAGLDAQDHVAVPMRVKETASEPPTEVEAVPGYVELTARQISLSLAESVYDPTDAVGRPLFNVLATVAEFESDLIRLRTREGMKVAKANGRLRGNQPKLNRRQEAHLVSLVHSGDHSTAEVADLFGVGRSTVYRAIERQRNEARTGLSEATTRR